MNNLRLGKVDFKTFSALVEDCPSMCVLISRGDEPASAVPWYELLVRWFLVNIMYPLIRQYQESQFPGGIKTATHVRAKVLDKDDPEMPNHWFSYTFPTAVIGRANLNPKCAYKLVYCKSVGEPRANEAAWDAFYGTFEELDGRPYDLPDNVAIFMRRFFKVNIPDLLPGCMVCSTSVAKAFIAYWKLAGGAYPFADIKEEDVSPACFENLPDLWGQIAEYDPKSL
jgi:hypothetical protein